MKHLRFFLLGGGAIGGANFSDWGAIAPLATPMNRHWCVKIKLGTGVQYNQ